MKYFVLSLFIFAVSCKKDTMPSFDPGTMEHGSISALLNGEDWIVSGEARRDTEDSSLCNIHGSASEGYAISMVIFSFSIRNVPLKVGKYTLSGKANGNNDEPSNPYASISIYDDSRDDSYYLNGNRKSCVEITEVDTLNGHIKGEFEIYMVADEPQEFTQNPDKLCFKKGEFAVDLLP